MKLKYIALLTLITFIALLILFPNIIYDKFIWKYFVGPIIADATGHPVQHNGEWAYEGYTVVSEVVYGILLVIFIYITYLIFEKYGVKVDLKFILSAIPFILYGAFARVLEDAGVFSKPLSYLFISPLIYIQVGILFFLAIFYGLHFHDEKTFAYSLLIKNAIYVILYIFIFIKYCKYNLHPLFFALLSIFSFIIYHIHEEKNYNASLLSFGILLFFTSFSMLFYYSTKNAFLELRILIAPILAFVITFILYIISKFSFPLFYDKLNIILIFSHMLDGLTTYFAVVDPFKFGIKYGEKHPLPDFLMKNFYGIGYPLLKLFVIIGIIYAINDLKSNLKNTIKFFILFLGLSPGLRDLLRILIGV